MKEKRDLEVLAREEGYDAGTFFEQVTKSMMALGEMILDNKGEGEGNIVVGGENSESDYTVEITIARKLKGASDDNQNS